MALNFDKIAIKGNEFLKDLAKELGYPEDTNKAGRVLKAILHALRNQLTVEESVQLMAQFPLFLKAVYVENWSLRKQDNKPRNMTEFIHEIKKINKQTAQHDFKTDDDVDHAIAVVFMSLRKYVSLGELEDIKAVLPKDLKLIVNNVLMI
ncbi:MAG: DUF2267 domain-containing protein [Bacteroidetes bacterium]|nr:DUF2267 domain-containing protein [Bacteroidota bacterium]